MTGELFPPGDRVEIDCIEIDALAPELRREFLLVCAEDDCPYSSGEAVVIGYRGQDSDGTHLLWAVRAP